MIYTLTINPSIDKTIYVENFYINKLNKVDKVFLDVGGKGINVSKTLKALNRESIALGFVGGDSGNYIKRKLDELKIKYDFIEIKENNRTNLKVVDSFGNLTELNEKGPFVNSEDIEKLISKINQLLNENDILVLSGSVCLGVEKDIYKKIIEIAHNKKTKTIVDVSGELLKEALKAKPDIIKPNIDELKQIDPRKDNEDMCLKLVNKKVKEILLSQGKDGALYYSKNEKYKIHPLKIEVKSTVGAGDAMVAALAVSLEDNLNVIDKLKLACACASGACLSSGTNPASKDEVNELIKKVKVTKEF